MTPGGPATLPHIHIHLWYKLHFSKMTICYYVLAPATIIKTLFSLVNHSIDSAYFNHSTNHIAYDWIGCKLISLHNNLNITNAYNYFIYRVLELTCKIFVTDLFNGCNLGPIELATRYLRPGLNSKT